MMIRGLLFLLFLYTLLVWIVAGYLGGPEMIQRGLFWTGVGVAGPVVVADSGTHFRLVARSPRTDCQHTRSGRGTGGGKSAAPDDAALRQIVQDANLQLEKAEAYRGTRTTIFDLPMYLVLGTEGTGKTSVMLNSGMEAHLLAGQASAGGAALVPTRVANIWLAKGSIYVELSSRMFAADPTRFAEFVRELRPEPSGKAAGKFAATRLGKLIYPQQRPSNLRGVLLVSDLKEFLGTPEMSKLDRAAALIRARLDAVAAHFGLNLPVYLLFNRAEQIPFFKDYFARMSENEVGQVFGIVTPREAAAGADQVWARSRDETAKPPLQSNLSQVERSPPVGADG